MTNESSASTSFGHNNGNSNENKKLPINNADLLALRAFVTAPASSLQQHHPDIVVVDLTHENLLQRHIEIRLNKHMSVQQLYLLIHQKTGSVVDDQILQVYDVTGDFLQTLPMYADEINAVRPIGYYNITQNGMRIHCVDTNPFAVSARGALENVSLVPKYVMKDEEYDQRSNTLRAWAKQQQANNPAFTLEKHAQEHAALQVAIRRHKVGLPLPEGFMIDENGAVKAVEVPLAAAGQEIQPSYGPDSVAHCKIGDRCQVQPGGRRGTVAWVGSIPRKSSSNVTEEDFWVGVKLDEPIGNNNGTFKATGERYFETADKHGAYCRGKNVEVGDFPERDIMDSDSEDEL